MFLAWLLVFPDNGQIYVHEICQYPIVQNTFYLWSDDDGACIKHIWIECISNEQCLIFITKMSFVLITLYSLVDKKIVSSKKKMIPKTTFISGNFNIFLMYIRIFFSYYVIFLGITFLVEKNVLLVATDVGKFICMYISTSNSEVTYTLKTINNNFKEQIQNYTCTSVIFSKNQCACILSFE